MTDAEAFRRQARQVATERLLKARGLLTTVAPAERIAIEQVAYAVAAGVAGCLLEEAARNSVVEAALGPQAERSEAAPRQVIRRKFQASAVQTFAGN
ncbi:MAG TPA: hypothetical protein VGJ27_04585 [Gaiellaceae bacterium]